VSLLGRVPSTPLVTRLLAALTVVLAISFVVTYVVESDLTRGALRDQAEAVLDQRAEQAQAVLRRDTEAIHAELQSDIDWFPADVRRPFDDREKRALIALISEVASRRPFTLLGVYDRSGAVVEPMGPELVPPPEELFASSSASSGGQVVPTTDDRWAYVSAELFGLPGEEIVLAFGFVFDEAYATTIRDAAGGADIVLEAGGEVIATSLPGTGVVTELEEIRPEERDTTELVVDDRTYWGQWQTFARPGDEASWGLPARLGVMIDEPLARLDAQLVRNRLGAGAALLVIATLLAWLVGRRLTKPLRELTATAASIASGDRDASFPVTGDDEVGVLARALEDMRRGLGHQLELIQRQAEALRDAGGRLVHAQDEARRRMAGDLHDGVQRQLVMLRLHIGFGRERIRRAPDETEAVLDELATEVDQVLSRLRETAQGIYPSILRDRGLEGALFSLGTRSSLPVELEVDPEPLPRLPHDVEANTYFLASEAVTNAVKHAQASRIGVTVRVDGDVLLLTVRDDGRGFDMAVRGSGRGLGNMQDRARALGGRVELATGTGGTVVTARLPISASVAGALEEEQDGRDAAVDLEVLAESQLLEDRVDVLLDGALGDREVPGDPRIALPGRHEGEDVELSWRESREP
jgi:signal transduction histidine kinase